jgi:two-component system, NarL family, sensor histidine kinase DesK
MSGRGGAEAVITPRGPDGSGDRRRGLKLPFVAAALFFTVAPLLSLLANPPESAAALALLLAGWAIFVVVLASLLRGSPFERTEPQPMLAVAIAAIAGIAVVVQVAFHVDQGAVLYFYAGVTASRLGGERWALTAIALVSFAAGLATWWTNGDVGAGLTTGVTVGTICLTLFALSALGRANRELHAARTELAELAVVEERSRIARDLHDTLGHSLSLIALKSELARRVLADDPARAAAEIADVEVAARDALASVRETVSGYRRPSLAMELAGARTALQAAGIENEVEPAPDGLPPDVDAMLGWAVREGVTNVLRHSDASRASIRIVADGESRAVEVVDDGTTDVDREGTGRGANTRHGSGLDGLRERAATLGGEVEAGPLPDRGFRLRVSVPLPVEGVG